jgi:maleylpyruvate isomerase
MLPPFRYANGFATFYAGDRMRLYSMYRNSAGWRVRLALHAKGIDFEYVSVRTLPPGVYRAMNPQGLLPTLEVDGRFIMQSAAILEFIDETWPNPPLLPSDPLRRAETRAFAQHIACDLHPLNNNRVRRYLAAPLGCSEPEIMRWYQHWTALSLCALEEMLARSGGDGPCCFTPEPGLADFHLVPQMHNARRFGCDLKPYPRLRAADAHCRGLSLFRRADPENLPDYMPELRVRAL